MEISKLPGAVMEIGASGIRRQDKKDPEAEGFSKVRELGLEAVPGTGGGRRMDEARLIERARAGDQGAFSLLVSLHQERMLHAAYSFLGNREDALDAAQEMFVKAYGALGQFKGNSKFSTWLYRILANQCKDFLRRKKVRRNLSVTLKKEPEDENLPPAEERIVSHEPSALDQTVDHETGALIREALETLPLQQKNAFTLRYLEGLNLQEIAEALEISEGAVKAHLWQAAQKMQKQLAVHMSGKERS